MIIKLPKKNLETSLNLTFNLMINDKFENINILDLRQDKQVIINGK